MHSIAVRLFLCCVWGFVVFNYLFPLFFLTLGGREATAGVAGQEEGRGGGTASS